jgi:hypothetical protein
MKLGLFTDVAAFIYVVANDYTGVRFTAVGMVEQR